jgi:hypothetical protein
MRRLSATIPGLLLLALVLGCSGSKTADEGASPSAGNPDNTAGAGASATKQPGMIEKLMQKTVTVPEGTVLEVRLNESISSKTSQPGESFSAVVADPVEVEGKVAIPKGAEATGTVIDAKPLGKFKGAAKLQVELDSVSFGGNHYKITTATIERTKKGKGKRTAVMIGGGAGLGAIIGGIAGGGKGAAIGAGVGAGAGTAGAYFTGNKDFVLPAETLLSFKLLKSVDVKQ